jgi:hypothetical protein
MIHPNLKRQIFMLCLLWATIFGCKKDSSPESVVEEQPQVVIPSRFDINPTALWKRCMQVIMSSRSMRCHL